MTNQTTQHTSNHTSTTTDASRSYFVERESGNSAIPHRRYFVQRSHAEIRAARIANPEKDHPTVANMLGCSIGAVHRAVAYASLTGAERESILYAFLGQERVNGISGRMGISPAAVIETVRMSLLRDRVETVLAGCEVVAA